MTEEKVERKHWCGWCMTGHHHLGEIKVIQLTMPKGTWDCRCEICASNL